MSLADELKAATIRELSGIDIARLTEYARENHEELNSLYKAGIIDDTLIESALEEAVFSRSRKYYELIKKDFEGDMGCAGMYADTMPTSCSAYLAYALTKGKFSEDEIKQRVKEKLSFVELEETEELMPSELSGGMQKRIALARAMANNPDYIFFDEPTTGLDPITAQTINELIKRVEVQTGTTIIVVTHDLESAYFVGQKLVLLRDGEICFEGTPAEFQNSDLEFVKTFRTGGKNKG